MVDFFLYAPSRIDSCRFIVGELDAVFFRQVMQVAETPDVARERSAEGIDYTAQACRSRRRSTLRVSDLPRESTIRYGAIRLRGVDGRNGSCGALVNPVRISGKIKTGIFF